jgi:hypothetical protein
MTEPIRDQVLDQIVAVLTALVTDPAAAAPPAVVTRQWQPLEQFNEFPVLIVTEASGSTLQLRTLSNEYEHAFRVDIVGYVKGDDQVIRSRALERLWHDVVKALLANATLATGGLGSELVRDITIDGPRETDGGLWEAFGAFVQPVTVWFTEQLLTS